MSKSSWYNPGKSGKRVIELKELVKTIESAPVSLVSEEPTEVLKLSIDVFLTPEERRIRAQRVEDQRRTAAIERVEIIRAQRLARELESEYKAAGLIPSLDFCRVTLKHKDDKYNK
jgi:hypothetical protein